MRPGFVRVSFPYHLPQHLFRFVLRAVQWVADHGWRLLSEYMAHASTGEWKHKSLRYDLHSHWLP